MFELDIRESTHELVAPVPKHEVIGAKSLSQRLAHISKKLVPSGMSARVIHGLQTVHIDERHNQRTFSSAGAIDFVLKFSEAGTTPQRAGEVIDQILLPLVSFSVERGLGPIKSGLVPVHGRLVPVQCCLLSIRRRLSRVREASIKRRLISVQGHLVTI